MILNEISSFETEYERVLRHVIWETNSGPMVFSSQTFFTSESGKTLGVLILTGCCYGTLSEQKHVVKNLYSKGIFEPDHYFIFFDSRHLCVTLK